MQHEPRPTIHIEKQLWWACKLDEAESLGIFKVDQQCLPGWWSLRYGISLVQGFYVGGFRKGTMASAHLDARHLSFSQYVTVPYKLLPQCWSSEGVSLGG